MTQGTIALIRGNNFDSGWRFTTYAPEDEKRSEAPAFDDSSWRTVDLPHDWSIEAPFAADHPSQQHGGYVACGIGWYRKSFVLPADIGTRRVVFEFDGIYMAAEVFLNGSRVAYQPCGYTSFHCDVSDHVHRDGTPNTVAVRVDNSLQPSSRWYTGSGIYRNVRLTITDSLHLGQWGVTVTTPEVSEKRAVVKVSVAVQNDHTVTKRYRVNIAVIHKSARAAETVIEQTANKISTSMAEARISVDSPKLWDIDHPELYTLLVEIIENGTTVDSMTTAFGIRSIAFDIDGGFLLNGRSVKMKGVCMHHDNGCLGAAWNRSAEARRIRILKGMGVNAIRTSHNPPAPGLLDLCDEMGMLVMDEAFDEWRMNKYRTAMQGTHTAGKQAHPALALYGYSRFFDDWHEKDTRAFVRRDRNHPSVVIWSIGNEIPEQGRSLPDGIAIGRRLVGIVHEEDSTRAVTCGGMFVHFTRDDGFNDIVDVAGYNYSEPTYAAEHTKGRLIIGSETSSHKLVHKRGTYPLFEHPRKHNRSTLAEESWKIAETSLAITMENKYAAGLFMWTGFDYIGETGTYTWPWRSSFYGIVDTAGFPKDSYHYYRAHWTNETVLHLMPHWNWEGHEGSTITVRCLTNCDEVELCINGKSCGRKKREPYGHLTWDVCYERGTCSAKGYRSGKEIASCEIRTTGAPVRMELTADRSTITADGHDISYLTARLLDANGSVVPAADNDITFTAEGGRIAGVDNGDPEFVGNLRGNTIPVLAGMCIALAASDTPGTMTIQASSAGLPDASVAVSVR
ncbi:MAG: glycoside hydrolase family 2 TIM barrel-domain containing protein [Spirochaetota bacterium]